MRCSTSDSFSPTTRWASLAGTRMKPKTRRTPSKPATRAVPSSRAAISFASSESLTLVPIHGAELASAAKTVPVPPMSSTFDPGLRSSELMKALIHCRSTDATIDGVDRVVDRLCRIGGDERGRLRDPSHQIIADDEFAGPDRFVIMRPVRHVETERRRQRRAFDAPVGADDRHAFDPGHVGRKVGQIEIAGLAARQHGDIGPRHDLQHGAHRGHDFTLGVGAAFGEVEDFGGGMVDALGAAGFHQPHAVEHQRHHRQEGEDDETRANAEDRLAPRRCASETGESGHRHPHDPAAP